MVRTGALDVRPPAPPSRLAAGRALLPFVAVLLVGLVAWTGVLGHDFVFDDLPAIRDNVPRQAGDWWNAALGKGVRLQLARIAVAGGDAAWAKELLRDALRIDPLQREAAALLRDLERPR